jgi:hypothetical protein
VSKMRRPVGDTLKLHRRPNYPWSPPVVVFSRRYPLVLANEDEKEGACDECVGNTIGSYVVEDPYSCYKSL